MAGITPQLPLTRDAINGYTLITDYKNLVKQNFRNLMFTIPGERIMDLDFGIGLKRFLFEMDDPNLYGRISGRISQQVGKYLPYITIKKVSFTPGQGAQVNLLNIEISYFINIINFSDDLQILVSI